MELSTLKHHGIKGMHWGIRRFQNPDGSLTEEEKRRYRTDKDFRSEMKKAYEKDVRKTFDKATDKAYEAMNASIPRLNAKYSDKDLEDPKKLRQYEEEFADIWEKAIVSVFNERYTPFIVSTEDKKLAQEFIDDLADYSYFPFFSD